MAMRRRATTQESSDIDLTPMLDVVFIMLIFFIVTATFIKETGIEVQRPEAQESNPQKQVNILVGIGATNEIWIDNRRVDVRSVRAVIERLHAENPKGAVVVQADAESHTETLIAVIDSAKQAGVEPHKITVATDTPF